MEAGIGNDPIPKDITRHDKLEDIVDKDGNESTMKVGFHYCFFVCNNVISVRFTYLIIPTSIMTAIKS